MTNDSLENLCGDHNVITIYSAYFIECLKYFLQTSILVTLIDFSMVLITTIANMYLIYLLVKKKCTHLVFDRILISHAFNDLITNLLDLPLYHFKIIFNKFPFGKYACAYFLIIDQSTSTIDILHFIYMSYARIRCIKAPLQFKNETFIRYSNQILTSIWFVCILFWTPIVYIYNYSVYIEGVCVIDFKSSYLSIFFILVSYHLPLAFTIGATTFVILSIRFLYLNCLIFKKKY